jgi:ADP-dependent NAD(P)H-hydrate dehydratase
MKNANEWIDLQARLLRTWPLPEIPQQADKEVRGRVLVIAGSREIPGAALLAATAALRAGAGKLAIATCRSVADQLAFAVPEARVIALPESARGSLSVEGVQLLDASARAADAVLVGPGLMDETGTNEFVAALLPMLAHTPVILDALAMNVVKAKERFAQPVLITPHAGEMAHLLGCSKDEISANPEHAASTASNDWNAVIALKGAVTLIATPHGGHWRHDGGGPGLATSGSGDVLAGLIAGFAAQQAPLEQACAWGVVLHGLAGARLARRLGPLGYLARELPAEIPALLKKLRSRPPVSSRARPPRE